MGDGRYNNWVAFVNVYLVIILIFAVFVPNLMNWFWYEILVFIVIIVIFWNLLLRNTWYKESFRRDISEFLILSFFFVIFLTIANWQGTVSDGISLTLPFKNYNFYTEFSPDENIALYDLSLKYNFRTGEGSYSFDINQLNDTLNTRLFGTYLPPEVSPGNYRLTLGSRELIENISYKKNIRFDDDKTILVLYDFNESLDGARFNMTFRGNSSFRPNGVFKLTVAASKAYSGSDGTIVFNLGDYGCGALCFGRLVNSEPELNGDQLFVNYPQDYYKAPDSDYLRQTLTLNTIYKPYESQKSLSKDMQIALLVAGFAILVEIIKKWMALLGYIQPSKKSQK